MVTANEPSKLSVVRVVTRWSPLPTLPAPTCHPPAGTATSQTSFDMSVIDAPGDAVTGDTDIRGTQA
jgi:hypothetical protein